MWQFNTSFLLKATAITALGCLPMVYYRESGIVWTAFLLPISLAWLVSTLVGKHGQHEFKFKQLSDAVVEVHAINGRYDQWFTRGRIIAAGACLSVAIGFPMANIVDPAPKEFRLFLAVLVGLFAVAGVLLVGYSERRRVLTKERRCVTDSLLFGRLCWLRQRWQVREGDYLAVFLSGQAENRIILPEFQFFHMLYVCRSRRRYLIAYMFTSDRVVPDMEIAAHRYAQLLDLPYEGYRKEEVAWYRSAESPNLD